MRQNNSKLTVCVPRQGHTAIKNGFFAKAWGNAFNLATRTILLGLLLYALTAPNLSQAQTDEITLVSNMGQPGASGISAALRVIDNRAIGFVTGSNPNGYNLTKVELNIAATFTNGITVSLWSATSSGAPNARLFDFANPDDITTLTGVTAFTAPSDTVLAGNTRYFVSIDEPPFTGSLPLGLLAPVATNDEDRSSQPGFSIDNSGFRQQVPGSNPWRDAESLARYKFTVKGSPVPNIVTVTANESSIDEGDSVTFTFLRIGDLTDSLSISVSWESGPGAQYQTQPSSSVTFPANSNSVSVTVQSTENDTYSRGSSDTFGPAINSDASYLLGDPDKAVVTVTDDDPPPVVTLALMPSVIAENGGISTVKAESDRPSISDIEIDISTDANAPVIFTPNKTLVISAGETESATTTPVRLMAVDNNIPALDREVSVRGVVRNSDDATSPSPVTLTIPDDDMRVISITRQIPDVQKTNADSLEWRVIFSNEVTEVDEADFELSGTSAALSVAKVSDQIGTWNIRASGGDLADLNNMVILSFAPNQNIVSEAETPLIEIIPTGVNENSYDLDNNGPTVTITGVPQTRTSNTQFNATITFNEPVTGFEEGDIILSNATLSSFNEISTAPPRTKWLAGITPTASGDITLDIVANSATDEVGNGNIAVQALSLEPDTTVPTVTLSGSPQMAQEGAPLTFTLDLNKPAPQDLTISIDISETGDVVALSDKGRKTITIAQGGSSGSITVPTIDDDAGEQPSTVNATIVADPAAYIVGAPFRFDIVVTNDDFRVFSITRQDPDMRETNADVLKWRVLFPEPVMNVDEADFTLDGTGATLLVEEVVGLTGAWDITASGGDLADLNDTVTLSFSNDLDIMNAAGNVLSNTTPTFANEKSYIVDNTGPTVMIEGVPVTSTGPFTATIRFNERVVGFANNDIRVINAELSALKETTDDMVWTIIVRPTLDETVGPNVATSVYLNIDAGRVTDAAGNDNDAAERANSAYTAPDIIPPDMEPPRINSITRLSSRGLLTNDRSLSWIIRFSEPVENLDSEDFELRGTTGTTFNPIMQSSQSWILFASGGNLDGLNGTVTLGFTSNQDITDAAGNELANFIPLGVNENSFVIDNIRPSVTISGLPEIRTAGGVSPFRTRITFSEPVEGFDETDITLSGATLGAFGEVPDVTPKTVWSADVILTGDGDITFGIAENAATDVAGNGNTTERVVSIEPDITAPKVISITRQSPMASPTNADELTWRVVFSETIRNISISDFTISGTTARLTAIEVPGEPTIWDITASGGDLVVVDGAVTLGFNPDQDIADVAGNALIDTTPTDANENIYLMENTAPRLVSITRHAPIENPTNANELIWRVLFSKAVTEVDTSDFLLDGTTATLSVSQEAASIPGRFWSVTASGGDLDSLNGKVTLGFADDLEITDLVGNALVNIEPVRMINQNSYDLDNIAPRAVSITRLDPDMSLTNADSLTWRVNFSEVVANVDSADFVLRGSSATLSVMEASGETGVWDITATGGDLGVLNGEAELSFAPDEDITDIAGNALSDTIPDINDNRYQLDNTAPNVVSITRLDPGISLTNADSLTWRVSFSEAVANVDSADFVLGGSSATLSVMEAVGETGIWYITASDGNLVDLNGEVVLNLANDLVIKDIAGNDLSDVIPDTNNNRYELDNTAPMVTSITRQFPEISPTSADILTWRVVFSEKVKNVTTEDFQVDGTTAEITNINRVIGKTILYNVTASGGDLVGLNQEVTLRVAPLDIIDDAGNSLSNTTPTETDESSYILDNEDPTVVIDIPETNNGPFMATITFSEKVKGFEQDDIKVSDNAMLSEFSETGPQTIWTTTITPIANAVNGPITLSIPAGIAVDAAASALTEGNPNKAAQAVSTYEDITRPTVRITGVPATSIESFNATITFSEEVMGFEQGDITVSTNAELSMFTETTSGLAWTVLVTPTAAGMVTLDIAENIATDITGSDNGNQAAVQAKSDFTIVPTLTVEPVASTIDEGEPTEFRITLDRELPENINLAVSARLTETGDILLVQDQVVSFFITPDKQTIEYATIHDELDEINSEVTLTLIPPTLDFNSPSIIDQYLIGDPSAATVTVTDIDLPEINITTEDTTEGQDAVFTVARTGLTADELTVDVTVTGTGGVIAEQPQSILVTFEAGQDTKTLTIPTLDNDDDEPDRTVMVALIDDSADPKAFKLGSASAATAIIADDDLPIVTIELISEDRRVEGSDLDFILTRDGVTTDFLPVALEFSETGDVLSVDGLISVSIPPGETSITIDAYETLDDSLAENDSEVTLTIFLPITGSDNLLQYRVGQPSSVTVTVIDNDNRGITVEPQNLTISEGSEGTYEMALTSRPTQDVTITTSVEGNSVTLTPDILTFTPNDWNMTQTVTVRAIHDNDRTDDGVVITHSVAGADYEANDITADSVMVTLIDDDVLLSDDDTVSTMVTLSTEPRVLDEDAGRSVITVTAALNADPRPNEDIVVTVSPDSGSEVRPARSGIDFVAVPEFEITIPANQTESTADFTLTPVDNDIADGDRVLSISGVTTGAGLVLFGTDLTLVDDDARGITVTPEELTLREGGVGEYVMTLTSRPTGNVTITPSFNGNDITFFPASLTFTPINWDRPQTVTVTTAPDADVTDEQVTMTHAVAGADYADLTGPDLIVTVNDDARDSTAITLLADPAQVNEDAGERTITVTAALDAAARATETGVTVRVESGTALADDFTAVPDVITLTIPAGDIAGTAQFTLTPEDDDVAEEDETITVTGVTDAPSLSVTSTDITLTDDDTPGPSVTITGVPAVSDGPFPATIRFGEPVTGFLVGDITVGNATLSGFTEVTAGLVWTVRVTPIAEGAITLNIAANAAENAAGDGNLPAAQVGSFFTAPPREQIWSATLTAFFTGTNSFGCDNSNISGECDDNVVLTSDAFTLDSSHLTDEQSAALSGETYRFSLISIFGSALRIEFSPPLPDDFAENNLTFTFDGLEVDFDANSVGESTNLTNNSVGFTWSSGQRIRIRLFQTAMLDTPNPRVMSIARQEPVASPTNADELTWRVAFSEEVVNVAAEDFRLDGTTATLRVSEVADETGVWDVSASGGDLADLDGEVTLSFADRPDISDTDGNPLLNTIPTGVTDNVYELDNTRPTVMITGVSAASNKPFDVMITFSEEMTDFTVNDITADNATLSDFIATEGGARWTVLVTPTSDGAVTLGIDAGVAMDQAGNGNIASERAVSTYMFRVQPEDAIWSATLTARGVGLQGVYGCTDPNSVVDRPSSYCSRNLSNVAFTLNGTNYTVTTVDLQFNNFNNLPDFIDIRLSPVPAANIVNDNFILSVDGAQFPLTVNNLGLVNESMSPQVIENQRYELKLFRGEPPDITPPAAQIDLPETITGPFTAVITFDEAVNGFDANDVTAINATLSGFAETETGTTYEVRVTPTAFGVVTLDVAEGGATDAAGNGNEAAQAFAPYPAPPPANTNEIWQAVLTTVLEEQRSIGCLGDSCEDPSILTDNDFELDGTTYEFSTVLFEQITSSVNLFSNRVTPRLPDNVVTVDPMDTGSPATLLGSTLTLTVDGQEVEFTRIENFDSDAFSPAQTSLSLFNPAFDWTVGQRVDLRLFRDDTFPPTVEIRDVPADSDGPFRARISFSEPVTDFEVSDITAVNATLSEFTEVTPSTEWTVLVTPETDGYVRLGIDAGVAFDAAASNPNTAADQAVSAHIAPNDAIWASILTVQEIPGPNGCGNNQSNSECSDDSILSDDEFDLDGETYQINSIVFDLSDLGFEVSRDFPEYSPPVRFSVTINDDMGNPLLPEPRPLVIEGDFVGDKRNLIVSATPVFDDNGQLVDFLETGVTGIEVGDEVVIKLFRIDSPPTVTITDVPETSDGPFTATVTFDEPVTDFFVDDIAAFNATLSEFTEVTTGMEWTVLVTPVRDSIVTLDIAADVVMDAGGNGNTAAMQVSSDFTAPKRIVPEQGIEVWLARLTVADIGSLFGCDNDTTERCEDSSILSDHDFELDDDSHDGSYDVEFIELDGNSLEILIFPALPADIGNDLALLVDDREVALVSQRNRRGLTTLRYDAADLDWTVGQEVDFKLFDRRPPTVEITGVPNPSFLPFTATITFNETVTGFEQADITPVNASLSDFTEVTPGLVWTVLVTPVAPPATTVEVTLDIPADAAQDASGFGNAAAVQARSTYAAAATPPGSEIWSTQLTVSDIPLVGNGCVSNSCSDPSILSEDEFTLSGVTYQVNNIVNFSDVSSNEALRIEFRPGFSADFDLSDLTLRVNNRDLSLKFGRDNLTSFGQFLLTDTGQDWMIGEVVEIKLFETDIIAPTVEITDVPERSDAAFKATATFSEPVTDFTVDDITAGNAMLSEFTEVTTGTEWTVLVTPLADGTVTLDIAAGAAVDIADNPNTAAEQKTSEFVALLPVVVSGADIWSATLTPQDIFTDSLGCTNDDAAARCQNIFILSDDDFVLGGITHNVTEIELESGFLAITVSPELSQDINTDSLTLVIDKRIVPLNNVLNDADHDETTFYHDRSALSWTAGREVAIRLSEADLIAPRVASITRLEPSTSPTNANSLKWQITFSEGVENVDAADFTVVRDTSTILADIDIAGCADQ